MGQVATIFKAAVCPLQRNELKSFRLFRHPLECERQDVTDLVERNAARWRARAEGILKGWGSAERRGIWVGFATSFLVVYIVAQLSPTMSPPVKRAQQGLSAPNRISSRRG